MKLTGAEKTMIAEETGYTPDYVRKVLSGDRKNEKITKAAKLVREHKKQLSREIKSIKAA